MSAQLLAQCERNTRVPMQSAQTHKINKATKAERRWGGVNVIYVGDFMQLPPVRETSLDTIPLSLLPTPVLSVNASVQAGLELIWNVTHVVELTIQQRCEDEWWMEIQSQCRIGDLSKDNHAFLHGYATIVAGSWLSKNQSTTCGNCCEDYSGECDICKVERLRRCRVFNSGIMADRDDRINNPNFKNATTIVANNDVRDQICKAGAARFARDSGQILVWSDAIDKISSSSDIAESVNLRDVQKKWIKDAGNKHGSMMGKLPLAMGMPVVLTDHLDRSSKSLLRGRAGTIVGWDLGEDISCRSTDHTLKGLPKCIYVQFDSYQSAHGGGGCEPTPCSWKIGDLEDGVYPITPVGKSWDFQSVAVNRYQLPISPSFARTAFSMQGRTLQSGKIDLLMSVDPINGYVAISRFKTADGVLILQPFDVDFFQQGEVIEPGIMLGYLKLSIAEREDMGVVKSFFQSFQKQRDARDARRWLRNKERRKRKEVPQQMEADYAVTTAAKKQESAQSAKETRLLNNTPERKRKEAIRRKLGRLKSAEEAGQSAEELRNKAIRRKVGRGKAITEEWWMELEADDGEADVVVIPKISSFQDKMRSFQEVQLNMAAHAIQATEGREENQEWFNRREELVDGIIMNRVQNEELNEMLISSEDKLENDANSHYPTSVTDAEQREIDYKEAERMIDENLDGKTITKRQ